MSFAIRKDNGGYLSRLSFSYNYISKPVITWSTDIKYAIQFDTVDFAVKVTSLLKERCAVFPRWDISQLKVGNKVKIVACIKCSMDQSYQKDGTWFEVVSVDYPYAAMKRYGDCVQLDVYGFDLRSWQWELIP